MFIFKIVLHNLIQDLCNDNKTKKILYEIEILWFNKNLTFRSFKVISLLFLGKKMFKELDFKTLRINIYKYTY